MANDLLFMDGFDHIGSFAQWEPSHNVIIDHPLIEMMEPASFGNTNGSFFAVNGGRGANGRVMSQYAERTGAHKRGARINVQDESEHLWVGFWHQHSVGETDVLRMLVLWVDDVAVWALYHTSNGDGVLGSKTSPDMDNPPPAWSTLEPSLDVVASADVTVPAHLRVHVHREAASGSVQVWSGEDLLLTHTGIAGLALPDGPLDVHLNGRSSSTGSSSNLARWDDVWVANSDYGDARIVVARPDADGFHTDGVPSTGTDLHALVSDGQPDEDTYITFSGGDIATFEMDTAELEELNPLRAAAVRFDARMTGPSTVDVVHRLGGSDHVVAELSNPDSAAATVSVLAFTNPATGASFALSDFQGGEFGVEA